MNYVEMSNEQRRQLIDAQQAFTAWRPVAMEFDQFGTMRSQASKGARYMYQVHGHVRKSLGRETPALKKVKAEHDFRRAELKKRSAALEKRMASMAPVNRALAIGGMREIAARIVRALDRDRLLGPHVIVAGTNALHAYEAATGTLLNQEHVATTDADILWDNTKSLSLAATGIRREGLMGILRRVDKSFHADYGYNATNRDGYIVDLLCPESEGGTTTMKQGSDLEATPMAGANWLLASPKFEQVTVADDGFPLRLVVPEPRTFALHKLWVSQRPDRSPIKRPRDVSHARLVAELATKFLGLKFQAKDMPWLPPDLKALLKYFK